MMYASTKDLIKGFMDGVSTELQVRPRLVWLKG